MTDLTLKWDRLPVWGNCVLAVATGLLLSACGNEGNMTSGDAGPGQPAQALFAFYTDSEGESRVARIDPVTLQVLETNHIPTSAGGGKQKSYYYEGRYVWTGGGGNVWGMDPETLEPVQGPGGPYIQANRSGEVGLAQVNAVGTSSAAATGQSVQPLFDRADYSLLQRTSWSEEEMARVDLCTLNHEARNAGLIMAMGDRIRPMEHQTPADVLFHNMGYSPVGIEPSPDGKLVMFGVRQGDHILFLDTDPDSPDFGRPVRFIHPRHGTVKDSNNAVVATFTSAYTAAGGTAPGNHRWNRAGNAAPSESDPQTYVEPCDSTMLRNAQGVSWSWTPDVDGDTITGMNVDTINTDAPDVYNIPLPVVKARNFQADIPTAGPWMASLINRNAGDNEFLFFVEYEGENAEGIFDVSDPAQVYEIQRMYVNLLDVLENPAINTLINGNVYQVNVDFSSTGGSPNSVSYRYVALAGDDGSGVSATGSTTGYLQKVSPTAPGPNYLLNGLTGRASTSNGTINRRSGSGEDAIIFSDEVWLTTTQGPGTLQIVDLRTSPPFRISETVDIPSAFQGYWSPDGSKYFQVVGGNIDVIDRQNRSLSDIISLPGPVSNIAIGTYTSTAAAPGPGVPGTPGGGGGGGGAAPPPNPCGG